MRTRRGFVSGVAPPPRRRQPGIGSSWMPGRCSRTSSRWCATSLPAGERAGGSLLHQREVPFANRDFHEWLTGAYHAHMMNIYQRHGDMVKICTGADFAGNRWTVNAVLFSAWGSWLLPSGSVMRLFKRVNGKQAVRVASAPRDLDIAASRTGNRFCLHVTNMNYGAAVEGMAIVGGKVHRIALANPREAVDMDRKEVFAPVERNLAAGPVVSWRFPARSVCAVEMEAENA